MNESILHRIYECAALCRAFEEECFRRIKSGHVRCPTYLSAGQEFIPATISVWLEEQDITDRQIFIQHRGHSHYLCFGGNLDALVLELLGDSRGCAGGMGGSASIQSKEANIYGHDGLMGTQVPIAVGACYANRKPTICFLGDAAAEEDYVLAGISWSATQQLPFLCVVEDNDLAILTRKQVRRSWSIVDVAKGFGLWSVDVNDDPDELYKVIPSLEAWPALINVNTTRKYWHAGAGCDDPDVFDRHHAVSERLDAGYVMDVKFRVLEQVKMAWEQQCPRIGNFARCELPLGHVGVHKNEQEEFFQIDVQSGVH